MNFNNKKSRVDVKFSSKTVFTTCYVIAEPVLLSFKSAVNGNRAGINETISAMSNIFLQDRVNQKITSNQIIISVSSVETNQTIKFERNGCV